MEYTEANLSTIATYVAIIIGPFLVKYGIEIDQSTLVTFLTTLITIIIAIWSSKHPNTFKFLGNQPEEDGLIENE